MCYSRKSCYLKRHNSVTDDDDGEDDEGDDDEGDDDGDGDDDDDADQEKQIDGY